jgi:hypothetical protein
MATPMIPPVLVAKFLLALDVFKVPLLLLDGVSVVVVRVTGGEGGGVGSETGVVEDDVSVCDDEREGEEEDEVWKRECDVDVLLDLEVDDVEDDLEEFEDDEVDNDVDLDEELLDDDDELKLTRWVK